MSNKSSHPDEELFDYLSGSLDQQAARLVEAHLSKCAECATVERLMRSLKMEAGALLAGAESSELKDAKSQGSTLESQISNLKSEIEKLTRTQVSLPRSFTESRARQERLPRTWPFVAVARKKSPSMRGPSIWPPRMARLRMLL
jgi:hypothetical protein